MAGKGIAYPFTLSPGIFVAEGDSLTEGHYLTIPYDAYPWQMVEAVNNDWLWYNTSVSGTRLNQMVLAARTNIVDAKYNAEYRVNVAVLWAGTNDLWHTADTAQTIYDNAKAWCQGRAALGFRPIYIPPMACTYPDTPADYESRRQALLTLLAADSSWCTYVNINTDARLQDPENTTYFYDKLHLKRAGYGVVAGMVGAALP